jgi:crotonobetainyl-CoA:carnitine CoA-transferase CaiB-like acyl-CoA transferase
MHVALPVGQSMVEQIGTPFHLSANPPVEHRAAPLPGGDNEAILAQLGFDAAAVQALTAAGVFSSEKGARA